MDIRQTINDRLAENARELVNDSYLDERVINALDNDYDLYSKMNDEVDEAIDRVLDDILADFIDNFDFDSVIEDHVRDLIFHNPF